MYLFGIFSLEHICWTELNLFIYNREKDHGRDGNGGMCTVLVGPYGNIGISILPPYFLRVSPIFGNPQDKFIES